MVGLQRVFTEFRDGSETVTGEHTAGFGGYDDMAVDELSRPKASVFFDGVMGSKAVTDFVVGGVL